MSEVKDDTISPFSRAVLELFGEELREVRFPDLDHDSLRAAAEELQAAQLEVECIEAALTSARELARERARMLTAQATRGLSYARIYATGNSALGQRIAQIDQLGPDNAGASAAPAKKRGRPRKENASAELFASDDAHEGAADEAAA